MSDGLAFRGTYELTLRHEGETRRWVSRNTLTWQGVTHLFRDGLTTKTWLFTLKNGAEGSVDDTAGVRPWHVAAARLDGIRSEWLPSYDTAGVVTNRASPAKLIVTEDVDVDGICLLSSDGAVLLSVAEWYATQELRVGDELEITYTIEGTLS